ncbi:MAG: hypothetical protein ABIR68_09460 [Ilumatobacteraceae bacterium]
MNSLTRRVSAAAVRRLPVTFTVAAAVLLGACTSNTHSAGSASPVGPTTATSVTSSADNDAARGAGSVPVVGATAVAIDGSSTSAPATGVSVAIPASDATTVATTVATSAQSPSTGNPAGSPTDPCTLLSPGIAAAAIGTPVGDPKKVTDKGNASCLYHAADPSLNRLVYLTTYAVVGSPAILAAAAATFRDAQPVPGLGDAAAVSVQSQAVGVLVGTTVFALGVVEQNADGTLQLLTQDQLVAVARAVLDGR